MERGFKNHLTIYCFITRSYVLTDMCVILQVFLLSPYIYMFYVVLVIFLPAHSLWVQSVMVAGV